MPSPHQVWIKYTTLAPRQASLIFTLAFKPFVHQSTIFARLCRFAQFLQKNSALADILCQRRNQMPGNLVEISSSGHSAEAAQ